MKHWSTAGLPAPTQFESWHQIICNSFVPLRTELQQDGQTSRKPNRNGFNCSLTSHESDDLFFGEVAGQEQWVYRDAHTIDTQDRPYYFLNIQRTGHALMEQVGKQTVLRPNSFAILDATLPFRMQVSDCFNQLSIKVPKARLAPFLNHPEQVLAQSVSAESGFGKIVAQALMAIADESETLDPHSARLVIDHALAMTGHALNKVQPYNPLNNQTAQQQPTQEQRLLRIRRQVIGFLEQHLDDPDLNVQQAAKELGLSARYIQLAFAAAQESVSHWILNRRLQRCHAELSTPQYAKQSIGQLAFRYGFNDLSYFNRSFKRRYGVTPSQSRAV
jgi:AraC family transcriptional regulator, positive regulator of tynA and feaB